MEIDNFYAEIGAKERKTFKNKADYLKIAFFDIWLSNEDRNQGNYNLLIDIENENQFVPIDHDAIFNTGNLDKGLYLITLEDSLIYSGIFKSLFPKRSFDEEEYITNIKNEVFSQSIDFEKQIRVIEININKLFHLNYALPKAKKFVIGCEPSNDIQINHRVWNNIRKTNEFEFVDISEAEKISEYARSHGIQPLF